MFCAISLVFSIVNTMLFTLTQSPIFFYATLSLVGMALVLAFSDEYVEKKVTKLILFILLSAAAWYAYEYGRHVLGVDWEIIVSQSSLLVMSLGISCLPDDRRKTMIM